MTGIDDRELHKTRPVPAGPRPSIYELRKPDGANDLGAFVDAHVPLPSGGRVLDAGCGPGQYLEPALARAGEVIALDIAHVRLVGIDIVPTVTGDVEAIPFADSTFDAVLAMHMLYHVPDIPQAVRELRRVLRDDGVLYAFTNSERAQWELAELVERCGCDPLLFGDSRFSNESGGALLATAFHDVTLLELTDTWLEVTDAECIVDDLENNRYMLEAGLRAGLVWPAFLDAARRDAQAVIDRDGAFRMHENHGLFTCRS